MKELMTMCCYGRKKLRQSLYQNTIGHVHLAKRRSKSKGENNSGYDRASDSCHSCSESYNNSKSVVEQSEMTLFSRPSVLNLQKLRSITSNEYRPNIDYCMCIEHATLRMTDDAIHVLNENGRVTHCSYL
jgi:hypothetical protein